MASVLRKLVVLTLILSEAIFASELDDYEAIKTAHRLQHNNLPQLIHNFISKYPNSKYIPELRILSAESATTIEESIAEYQKLLYYYRNTHKRDEIFYALCQRYYLKSDWKNLLSICNQAIQECTNSNLLSLFYQLRAIAHYKHSKFDDGFTDCQKIPNYSREYLMLSYALFLKAELSRNIWGFSRDYISDLTELIHGFKDSPFYPSFLYMLGQYYEYHKMYNHAWSVYTHIVSTYPKSPESVYATNALKYLSKFKPTYVPFIPDESIIAQGVRIDIKPNDLNRQTSPQSLLYYTIVIGPLYNLQKARQLQKLIVSYVVPVHIVKKAKSFEIYAGYFTTIDEGLHIKIQLAEELGINGFIAEIYTHDGKQYIYGE